MDFKNVKYLYIKDLIVRINLSQIAALVTGSLVVLYDMLSSVRNDLNCELSNSLPLSDCMVIGLRMVEVKISLNALITSFGVLRFIGIHHANLLKQSITARMYLNPRFCRDIC